MAAICAGSGSVYRMRCVHMRKVGFLGAKEPTSVSWSGGRLSSALWGGDWWRRERSAVKRVVREVK
jgi:hypothetical protein